MMQSIKLTGVTENNLKNINVEIPYYKHTVITGVSGSGKSTLAYDVLYATAQRKLLDCMSDSEKGFSTKMRKPKVHNIEGLSTVISLQQVKPNHNPRSTIGTYTSIGSYIRNLMALHGECKCLCCNATFKQSHLQAIVNDLEALPVGTIVEVSYPYFFTSKTERIKQLNALRQKGYRYIYVNNEKVNLRDIITLDNNAEFVLVVEGKFQTSKKLSKAHLTSLKNAIKHGDNYISITLSEVPDKWVQSFYEKHGCNKHHLIATTMDASSFSYNDISCACPECMGSGTIKTVHPSKVIKNPKKTLKEGPFFQDVYSMSHPYSYMSLYSLASQYNFSFDTPYEELSSEAKNLIMYGTHDATFILKRPEGYDKVLPNYLSKEGKPVSFEGILTRINVLYHEMLNAPTNPSPAQELFFKTYMHEIPCPYCNGTRLKKIKLYTFLNRKNYAELGKMEFSDLLTFFNELKGNEVSQPIIDALKERLVLMQEIGLDYLCFERRIDSLSGGEYQRLRIANQIGSGLVGLTYIIDEPTDGLHGTDNQKIIRVINRLLEKGNTVITIEHDYDIIKSADYIIEMGPGAGVNGGKVIATGTLEELRVNPHSIIGKYLEQKPNLSLSPTPLTFNSSIKLHGIEANNIKNVDLEIPLYKITCFTGVSGSGKSSIVYEVLYKTFCSKLQNTRVIPGKHQSIEGLEQIKNIICIDQALLNGKNTSIPATYLDLFDSIRMLFAESVPDDHEMKSDKSYFSFNSKGACPSCKGKGYISKYIQYFGETKIECCDCNGQQYIDDVLAIKYQNKNIKQVLDMTFLEALSFFENHPKLYDKISLVCDLGLGYMQLGQPLSTISGGEAQRMKLAREMTKYKNKKNLLYIFDEPTVGLHTKDIDKILKVMKRIIEEKNTIVLVEHNPDMILNADYIVDLGPGAGKFGGEVTFMGTPSEMLLSAHCKTADYLRNHLHITPKNTP